MESINYVGELGTTNPVPDLCLFQDYPLRALPGIVESHPNLAVGTMVKHKINGVRAMVGILAVCQYPLDDTKHYVTHEIPESDGRVQRLEGINNKNERHLGEESDLLVEATERRVLSCFTVIKDGVKFRFGHTHGMWARGGEPNTVQRESTRRLRDFLIMEAAHHDGIVLVGDLNISRGGEMYQMLMDARFRDCIPPEVKTTLDPSHPAAKYGIVVDYFMTLDHGYPETYSVSNVTLRSGVSDHCAVSAVITRI